MAGAKIRWRFQVRLSTLLLLITLLAVGLAWWSHKARQAKAQRELVRAVGRLHGLVEYDWGGSNWDGHIDDSRFSGKGGFGDDFFTDTPSPSGPRWLRKLLGDEYFQTIVMVKVQLFPLEDEDIPNSGACEGPSSADVDALMRCLEGCTSLERLGLQSPDNSDCHNAPTAFRVRPTPLDDRGLVYLRHLTNLTDLSLEGLDINGEGLVHLEKLQKLERLNLAATGLTDAAMPHIGKLKALRQLDLRGTQVTTRRFDCLSGLTNLQELDLSETSFGRFDWFARRATVAPPFHRLKTLNLYYAHIEDNHLRFLARFPNLKTLNLSRNEIHGFGLRELRHLKRLEWLDLSGNPFDPAANGLIHLGRLTNLRYLNLDAWGDDAEGELDLQFLSKLTKLQHLLLWRCRVDDADLIHLQNLRGLTELDLAETPTTDAGLVHLRGLTKLRNLDLSSTKVSDEGLVYLHGLKDLQEIDLQGTAVTKGGVQRLRAAIPQIKISTSRGIAAEVPG